MLVPYFFLQLQFHVKSTFFYTFLLSIFLYVDGKELLMDIMDYDGDRASNIRTIPILIGKKKTNVWMLVMMISGLALIIGLMWKNTLTVVLITVIFAFAMVLWFSHNRKYMRLSIYLLWLPLLISMISFWIITL